MEGGKYLGAGTYGCIFYPAIKCNNGAQPNGVGKIFSDVTERDVEYQLGKRFQHLDPNGSVLNILTNECDVTKNEVIKNDESSQCKHINSSTSLYNQLIYKEKGIDLDKILKTNKDNYCLFDTDMIQYVTNLLKGVKLLQDNDLAHMDIKLDNILISDKNKLLLIDFGLTRDLQEIYDINKSDYLLKYSYYIYPPEFKVFMVLDYIKKLKLDALDVKASSYYSDLYKLIIEVHKKKLKGYKGYDHVLHKLKTINVYQTTLEEQFSNFVISLIEQMKARNMTHKSCMCDYFKRKFAMKADVFSVGYVLLCIYYYSKPSKCKATIHKYMRFVHLIKQTWCMNPYERYTVDDILKEYKDIILTDDKQHDETNFSIDMKSPSKSNKYYLEKCMKNNKKVLQEMVEKNKLPKSIKYLNKRAICEKLSKYLSTGARRRHTIRIQTV